MRAIRRALELGAEGVEIDVRLTRDGKLAVIHDATLRRTASVSGFVSRKTMSELHAVDAGKGEPIPTLEEVLDLIAGRAWLNIELKARGTSKPVTEAVVWAVENGSGWNFDRITISSFNRRQLSAIPDPRVPIGLLLARRPLKLGGLVRRLRASSVHLPVRLATAATVRRIHEIGARVLVFTVNDSAEMERLRLLGVDGVFTDFPDRIPNARVSLI